MQVYVLGARGSSATSGAAFQGIGGHTSSIAIARDGEVPTLVLDAGTGIREATALLGGESFRGAIVLGHLHWDHVMGLPFFAGADRPTAEVDLYLPEQGTDARALVERVMGPPLFPIGPDLLRGRWTFSTYGEQTFAAGGFTVTAREIPHKGGRTMGLRVEGGGRVLAYLSDHAPQDYGPGPSGNGEIHTAALELARDADLLLHDAQYTSEELPVRGAFGHAAWEAAVELGLAAGVKRLLLFHHDPARTDAEVHAITEQARAMGGAMRVDAAYAGMHVSV